MSVHELWTPDENPHKGWCGKFFVGREGYAPAGVMAGFVLTGILVMHKMLRMAKGP